MISGIITPSGMLGGLQPHTVTVTPIAGEAVAVGDLVQFDLRGEATGAGYTDLTKITDFDNKKCPFNVVMKSEATTEAGIFGVVTKAAAIGQRCTVCVAGIVDLSLSASTTAGTSVIINGAGVGSVATTSGTGVGIGVALETGTGAAIRKVLFYGLKFGTQAA